MPTENKLAMSQPAVKRWQLKGFIPGVEGESKAVFRTVVVLADDFDRIAAERDALQERLNAADQRIDELTRPNHDDEQTLIAHHQWFIAGESDELLDQASAFQDKAYALGRARGLFEAVQQFTPVAVVLPERKPTHATAPDNDMRARLECKNKGYNEALDDTARLSIPQ
ncbi:hypothetical protein KW846_03895 [Pseudomonas sp. PDM32]|uniref:hypothetical protein n=1 Tax=Pseudomonas sp. PDM32 TaxID=2854768 RepID=UPI001C43E0B8|nr:hypothetical protein [Pseudomonas sp. PDM32]MBV7571835.1 hypothetical protein [Pseudomonas sp. PDM32]